jgi:hypothetical protein
MRLGECYSVPDHVVAQVRAFDPALRIKWGRAEKTVRVERKISRMKAIDPGVPVKFDDFEMAKDGYCLVYRFLPLDENWDKLLYTLRVMDIWKQGGSSAIADLVEADEEREKAEKRRSWKSDVHQMAAEMFRHLNTPRTGWNPYEVKAE